MKISIDFLQYQAGLKIKHKDGQHYIMDPLRRKYVVRTPEEVVRQLVVQHLIQVLGYPANKIAVEKVLAVNQLTKRFDILVYDQEMMPYFLIECKAPQVPISQATFRQIAIYNLPLRARFLMVTNGIDTFCCQMDYHLQSFTFLAEVPPYSAKSSPDIS